MASTPQSPYSTLSKPRKEWKIWLGPDSGIAPTAADETTRLRNPYVILTPGHGLPSCEFQYDLGGQNERIVDSALEAQFTRQVMVVQAPEEKGGENVLVFWGEIVGEGKSVADGESLVVRAAVMPYHFGDVLKGPKYRKPTGEHDAITHHDEIVFNPEVDGIIEKNRSLYSDSETVKYKHWVHPDSVRTATARQYAQDNEAPELWDLPNVINTLCWVMNPDEQFIKNPTSDDLLLWLADAPAVRNVKIPPGKYLCEYLDMILQAHGYGWRLDYEFDDEGEKQVSIVIFSLNAGQIVDLYQQRPGDETGASFTQSNTVEFDLETEIASSANSIIVRGGRKLIEVTLELERGWSESDDSLTAEDLTMSADGSQYETHQNAWRLWPANEGGDYCGTRTTVAPIGDSPLDLSSVLGANTIAKRRRALDCLTHYKDDQDDGARRRRPPFVRYYVDGNWKPLPEGWGEVVLEDQIAVYFGGDAPPADLIALGNNARLQLTCTIESDECIEYTAARLDTSPNGRTNQLLIDASDRFQYRQVQSEGDYLSVLAGVPSADIRDDTTALEAFAGKLRSIEDVAIIRGTATLIGIHLQYKIGHVVTRIKGREVSLNRMAKTASEKKYLQIVGVTYDYAAQKTMITIEPLQEGHDLGWIRSDS